MCARGGKKAQHFFHNEEREKKMNHRDATKQTFPTEKRTHTHTKVCQLHC
jgi:hypothetical protein